MSLPSPKTLHADISTARLLLSALALVLIWGSAFTMVGVGVRYISPIWLVAGRLVFGAMLVTTYAYLRGHRFPKLSDVRWRWYGLLGITGTVLPFFLLSVGQLTINSGITAIIVGGMPLITIILAHFFTDERLTVMKFIGFTIGFFGIFVLFLPDELSLGLISDWKAQVLILLAACSYAVTTVFAKRVPKTPASLGAAMMLICGASVSVIFALGSGIPDAAPPMIGFLMIIGLGLGSSGLANILYLWVIDKSGPTMLARINYFTPVASVIFGVTLLSEPFTWKIVASFLIVITGVMISRIGQNRR
ncbi:DMT family transporter [Fretibacter rubidus]|uniref:DMT family transporter n=1 Tax=Fretibacter rubidus TaxID=570162 RepID=UPI00352A721A